MTAAVPLAGARVLVTGGAGTIGSHVVDQVLGRGAAEVVILDDFFRGSLDNIEDALASGRAELVRGDICDAALVGQVMDGMDVVFHLAGIRITQCADDPRLANDILVNGTFNVIEAAAAAGVRKVVASSSASVYGLAEVFPTPEGHHTYHNDTLYGAAKTYNEGMLRAFKATHGLDHIALRYFNVYGPRMDAHGRYTEVLIRWIERLEAGQPPLIFGDGKQTMDFVHVVDIARANVLAAEADVTDEVFNVASGVETSLLELASALAEVMKADLAPEFGPARTVNGVTRRLADTSAARDRIGFTARIGLLEGLDTLVQWWRGRTAELSGSAVPAQRTGDTQPTGAALG